MVVVTMTVMTPVLVPCLASAINGRHEQGGTMAIEP
jgi:hypothetical protein